MFYVPMCIHFHDSSPCQAIITGSLHIFLLAIVMDMSYFWEFLLKLAMEASELAIKIAMFQTATTEAQIVMITISGLCCSFGLCQNII